MTSRTGVILNDRVLFQSLTGVGNYVQALLAALRDRPGGPDVRPFLSSLIGPPARPAATAPRPAAPADAPAARPGRPRRVRRWLRPALLRAYATGFRWAARHCALYHEPNHIPIRCDCPTITTIHDLSVLVHPEWHPADRVRWYERHFARGVAQSARFITVSEFTRRELVSRVNIAPDRIDVTPLAPRPAFRPQPPERVAACRRDFALPERFFLFVGTLEPRKNIPGLLAAYAALPAAVRRAHPLLLAGGWGWNTAELAELLRTGPTRDDVRLIGYVGDDVLACLYSAATALVWPTFYEGFGLPPLEALACGCPVIVSNVTSLPEVVGDAGVLLDPGDVASWNTAMRRMVEDPRWREDWRRRGPERAAQFSWARCAALTHAAYERVVGAVGGALRAEPAR